MALFSRRKKSADDAAVAPADPMTDAEAAEAPEAPAAADSAPAADAVPEVSISVQAFRGVGADAGPEVAMPADGEKPAPRREPTAEERQALLDAARIEASAPRPLPLAAALPPEQTESVPGMKDNVLLREALAQLEEGASNEQLLGVLRQALQGHLYIRVHGDARAQIAEGKPLSVAVVRDGDRAFMLAFSSAKAVRESVQRETDPTATTAVAQPVTAVLQQVVAGGFTGLLIDNASAPHRVVLPLEVLQKALEQGDPAMTLKTLLAAPREDDTPAKVGRALSTVKTWVAVNDGSGGAPVGIAEARTADGKCFLQVYSHPLEVVALGRTHEKPMPFTPQQLANVFKGHPERSGVIVDPAGPSIALDRSSLAPVLALTADIAED